MSRKRRHRERLAALEARAKARGVAVDPEALAPSNSYGVPDFVTRGYYVDVPFSCQECGASQIWTAEQQKWWYEVAKGYVYSTAKLCRPCRRLERERKRASRPEAGHPNTHLSPKLLLAEIHSDLEPNLRAAGFLRVGGIRRGGRHLFYQDCINSEDIFTISWNRYDGRLSAELLTKEGTEVQVIASVSIPRYAETTEIDTGRDEFLAAVKDFLDGLRVESRVDP